MSLTEIVLTLGIIYFLVYIILAVVMLGMLLVVYQKIMSVFSKIEKYKPSLLLVPPTFIFMMIGKKIKKIISQQFK